MKNKIIFSIMFIALISLSFLLVGCSKQYVCSNGNIVSSPNKCQTSESGKIVNDNPASASVESAPAPPSNKPCIEMVKYNDRRNEYGWLVIAGLVKNNCNYPAYGTINFILYDSKDNVITSDSTTSDPYEIAAGQTRGFEKTWTDKTVYSVVKRYEVSASG